MKKKQNIILWMTIEETPAGKVAPPGQSITAKSDGITKPVHK